MDSVGINFRIYGRTAVSLSVFSRCFPAYCDLSVERISTFGDTGECCSAVDGYKRVAVAPCTAESNATVGAAAVPGVLSFTERRNCGTYHVETPYMVCQIAVESLCNIARGCKFAEITCFDTSFEIFSEISSSGILDGVVGAFGVYFHTFFEFNFRTVVDARYAAECEHQ